MANFRTNSVVFLSVVLTGLFCQLTSAAADGKPDNPAPKKVVQDCIGDNNFIYHASSQLIPTTNILPAGTDANFILKAPFDSNATYFVKFDGEYLRKVFGNRDDITAAQIAENSPYVQSGLANKNDTLVKVNVPEALGGYWQTANIRIYGCETDGSPSIYSIVQMRVSTYSWSTIAVSISAVVLYIAAGFALRALRTSKVSSVGSPSGSSFRFLDPVVLTAGTDGKGSLSKLQILFFSMIVFVLLFYILLRTGELSGLSKTVLLLLGIAAVGSTAAKGADVQQNKLDFDNWAWLVNRGWLGPQGFSGNNTAKWRDILTSDGEFDVYRYQNCIFSLVVGGALLVVGVNQLASFEIPTTLLGVLGLSQVVYVAGKLVTPPAFADLNRSVKNLRDLDQTYQATAANVARPLNNAAPPLKSDYDRFVGAAQATRTMFEAVTRLKMGGDDEPSPPK